MTPASSFRLDGDTASKTGPKPKPPDERFWALVDLGGPGRWLVRLAVRG